MPYRNYTRRVFHPYFDAVQPNLRSETEIGIWPLLLELVDEGTPEKDQRLGRRESQGRRGRAGSGRAATVCKIQKNPMDPVYTVVETSDDKFTISIPVGKDFSPENLDVKVKDRVVIVEIRMEQISEDGTSQLSQVFTKRIPLPEGAKVEKVLSKLTSEGVLKIEAPLPAFKQPPKPEAVEIPITMEIEDSSKKGN